MQILGIRGPKSKIEERFVECHMENWQLKMALFHWETKKKNWSFSVTDRRTESTTKTSNEVQRSIIHVHVFIEINQ